MNYKNLSYFVKGLTIFAVYFITARLGLMLDAVSGFASLVWLPTGISLASLLIWGTKYWPAITLGAFLANFTEGAPILAAMGISIGNTIEAVLTAYLLKRFFNFRNSLDRLKDVFALIIIAGFFSTTISATIGVISLLSVGIVKTSLIKETWFAWWIGDMISNLVIAPLILVWAHKSHFDFSLKRLWETSFLIVLLFTVNLIIFRGFLIINPNNQPVAYMIFPPLVWAALRFGQKGAVLTSAILATISVLATIFGFGPFATSNLSDSLLSLQIFMGFIAVSGMILAAIALEKERVEERKDEFISVASHELKTPVTTIKGYAQILIAISNKANDKKALLYLHKIDEQVNRLTELVNDLLDVSKIQSGKLELEKERFDLNHLIKEVVEDMQINTKHKIILHSKSNISIVADKYLIGEVLTNLISNAIKYSPKADNILVTLTSDISNNKISIQDFGIGIAKKDFSRLFERFFRIDNKIRESFSGLGLGLFIASEIIKRHGGSINVSSVKGKGSIFTIYLPKKISYE